MKLLNHAIRQASGLASHRALALFLAAVVALFPQAAFAQEGANVKLRFQGNDQTYLIISLVLGVIALAYGWMLAVGVMKASPGSEKMQAVGLAIKDGALAYLKQQIRTMLIFVLALAIGLVFFYQQNIGTGPAITVAVCFVLGVAASYIAGFAGMIMAVNANMRTANAALTSYKSSLEIAFRSGGVAGMVTVGIGLIGATLILWFGGDRAMVYLVGFGFGGSLAALFMRVGGGIFTKAADVGADLVGKVEAGIPEDDPRNPATIADNVGDNVGDCAGMAADIFESYEVTLVAAIILGAATAAIFDQQTWMRLVLFALMARGVGIIASIIGIGSVRGSDDLDADPLKAIGKGFYLSAGLAALATLALAWVMMGGDNKNTIRTSNIVAVEETRREDIAFIQSIRAEKAKAAKKQAFEIPATEINTDPRLVSRGIKKDDEAFVLEALSTDLETQPGVKPLTGFQKVSNFADKDIPALGYATQARPRTGEQAPAQPFQTIGSLFGGSGKDRFVVANVHVKADIPPRPAANGAPAQAGQNIDRSFWQGPMREGDLEARIKESQDVAKQQNINADIKVLDTQPVSLYADHNGNLAIGIPGAVERAYTLAGPANAITYYPVTAEHMNGLVAQNTGTPPQLPPTKTVAFGEVEQQTVPWWTFWAAITFGIFMAFAIERLTDYYVSTHKKPTQEVAGVSSAGPAPMIIQGFAYAAESSVFMVFAIVIALLFPLFLFPPEIYGGYILSFYGIALVGLGLLTTTGYVLAMDTFGPISDNAQGVYEMSGEGHDNVRASKAVQRLDAAGNTTKALTKGFAIATAVVAAVALFHSYLEGAHLSEIGLRLDIPEIFLGLLIGGAAPYLFTAFAINAVGRASFQLINEVRRQFREDPGIMAGTSRPDYGRCVAIVTAAAQKELLGPGILAIALPVAVGFGFSIGKPTTLINGQEYSLVGAQALGGFLAGAILSGQLLAVLLANSGGMWDNAKKLIEDGMYGGKGSEAHKAGIVCDTVGDPFKDTAGPALNPLIKVMNLVALLMVTAVVTPRSNEALIIITVVALTALAISIYYSKKGSMSSAMKEAQMASGAGDDSFSTPSEGGYLNAPPSGGSTPMTPSKKKLLVEEPTVEDTPKDES